MFNSSDTVNVNSVFYTGLFAGDNQVHFISSFYKGAALTMKNTYIGQRMHSGNMAYTDSCLLYLFRYYCVLLDLSFNFWIFSIWPTDRVDVNLSAGKFIKTSAGTSFRNGKMLMNVEYLYVVSLYCVSMCFTDQLFVNPFQEFHICFCVPELHNLPAVPPDSTGSNLRIPP